jgi:hypothetical protein
MKTFKRLNIFTLLQRFLCFNVFSFFTLNVTTTLSIRIFYLINNKYVTHVFFYLSFINEKFNFLTENTDRTYFLLENKRLLW